MTDIVERLRADASGYPPTWDVRPALKDAADEIERLREGIRDALLISDWDDGHAQEKLQALLSASQDKPTTDKSEKG